MKKVKSFLSKIWKVVKREKNETLIATKIIEKYLVSGQMSEEEKIFLKSQSADLAKLLPIVAAQLVPLPIPITPLLIIFGHKIGIDLLPKEQHIPDSYRKDEDEKL